LSQKIFIDQPSFQETVIIFLVGFGEGEVDGERRLFEDYRVQAKLPDADGGEPSSEAGVGDNEAGEGGAGESYSCVAGQDEGRVVIKGGPDKSV
jgi:hypothetical protein